jgi:hypothetical protein
MNFLPLPKFRVIENSTFLKSNSSRIIHEISDRKQILKSWKLVIA